MSKLRRVGWSSVALVASLVGCGTNEELSGPTAPVVPIAPNASLLGGVGSIVGGTVGVLGSTVGSLLKILTCDIELPVTNRAVIGPRGGTLKVGRNTLEIPSGALSQDVVISGTAMGDGSASVTFAHRGAQVR